MKPLLLELGPLKIYGYGAMIALGGFLSFALILRPRIKKDEDFWALVNAVLAGGFIGGRALHLLQSSSVSLADVFHPGKGFSVLGAFVGVPLAVWGVCRWRGLAFLPVLDIIGVMAPFWHVFGRIGCFLAGCCYGKPTTLPWAVTFTDPRAMVPRSLLGVPLHPAQLYEAGIDGLIAAWLWRVRGKPGTVAALDFLTYGMLRFGLEFVRGDTIPWAFGLTVGQGLGLALIALGGGWLCFRR